MSTKSEVESIYHCTVYMHACWQTASVTKSVLIGIKMKDLHFSIFVYIHFWHRLDLPKCETGQTTCAQAKPITKDTAHVAEQ